MTDDNMALPQADRATHEPSQASCLGHTVSVPSAFFIDCEFDGHNGPLLSFAIVRDTGEGMHITVTDAPPVGDPWVAKNVLPIMDSHRSPQVAWVRTNEVGGVLRAFIGDCQRPYIVADSPVDIGRFCQALSTGRDGGWASAEYPSIGFAVLNVDCYPTDLPGAIQHNAWWDAMALRHKFAQGTSGSAQDGHRLDPQGAGPVSAGNAPKEAP